MSDPLPSAEGNRGATPTWGSLLQLRTTERKCGRHMNNLLGKARPSGDRSIGRILRRSSRKCQRTNSRATRRSTENTGTCHELSPRGDTGLQFARRSVDMCSDMNTSVPRHHRWAAVAAALFCFAAPAAAQHQPAPVDNPATGEKYHIEGSAGFWMPNADIVISSEQLGIPGSQINVKRDLGLTDQHFPAFTVELRPA